MDNFIQIIKNFDIKIKKIMIYGLYFALLISVIATFILINYISISHSNFIFYIGIQVMKLAITCACSFFSFAFVIDKLKKDILL